MELTFNHVLPANSIYSQFTVYLICNPTSMSLTRNRLQLFKIWSYWCYGRFYYELKVRLNSGSISGHFSLSLFFFCYEIVKLHNKLFSLLCDLLYSIMQCPKLGLVCVWEPQLHLLFAFKRGAVHMNKYSVVVSMQRLKFRNSV